MSRNNDDPMVEEIVHQMIVEEWLNEAQKYDN
jgi:hypothetical protein